MVTKDVLEKLQKTDVNTEDGWNYFTELANKSGWDVQSLLTSQQTLDADAKLNLEQQKINDLIARKKSLEDSGISSENAEILAQRNFSPVSNYINEENPWLND